MWNCIARALVGTGALTLLVGNAYGAELREDFSLNPTAAGWQVWGETNLFEWDSAQECLKATWDSSRPNSYFYRGLGTVLAREDDFSLAFDLTLQDIATTTKSGPFEIAIGLIRLADATRTNFWRGSGVNAEHGARNAFELDYFPAGYYPGFGDVAASISPTLVSMDNGFASGFSLTELSNGVAYHIEMTYSASNATIHTTLSSAGAPGTTLDDVTLGGSFTDFRLDTLAICSYSDIGDDYDSVLAHGTIDNVLVRLPSPPAQDLRGSWSNGAWQVQFSSRTNWIYTAERTIDLRAWEPVSASVQGNGSALTLVDPAPPAGGAFYRVSAQRP